MSPVLIFAAHPDDEVLGCGGTLAKLADEGAEVHVAFLADGVGARGGEAVAAQVKLDRRREAAESACRILEARSTAFEDLPDNRLDSIPLLEITRRVETLPDDTRPAKSQNRP